VTDPRVARTREHVLAAAGELLAEEGREGFSIDAVARRSGVARTTIYRHWPELGELLFDTFRAMGHHIPQVDTGSVRGDLVALYGALAAGWETSCIGRCMPVLLDMTRRDPGLRDLHRRFIDERRAPSSRTERARSRMATAGRSPPARSRATAGPRRRPRSTGRRRSGTSTARRRARSS
jgi:AcrR family transcriptional regulator